MRSAARLDHLYLANDYPCRSLSQTPPQRPASNFQLVRSEWDFDAFVDLDVHLGNLVSASGLVLLLEIAVTPLDSAWAAGAVFAGLVCAWVCAGLVLLSGGSGLVSVGLCLATSSLNVVLTLAVALSICARLCPHEGKELVLIPVYFLLCMSRLHVSLRWPLPLFGMLALLLLVWRSAEWPSVAWSEQWNPPPIEWPAVTSPVRESGQGIWQGSNLNSTDGPKNDPQSALGSPNVSAPVAFAVIALFYAYDTLSQLCRVCETVVHFSSWSSTVSWQLLRASDGSLLRGVCAWAGVRGLLFAVLALIRSAWSEAFLSLFLAPLPTYSVPYRFSYDAVVFAFVLLLSCMSMAYYWFAALRRVVERLSRRGFTTKRVVRLQHILNALVVCSAWAFPLDDATLALTLRASAVGGVMLGAVLGACVGQKNGAC